MKKLFFIATMIVCFLQTSVFCQTDSAANRNAVSKLRGLLTDHIIEKAYLQFDRPYGCYVAGDTIYFKAYVTKGERHELTDISGMLHVDLINKNNKIMQSILLQLNNGVSWGDFALPDSLQKGSYRIRAYTEWMRNEKDAIFFNQYISVGSINSVNRASEAVKQTAQPVLQFFPEGGNLVAEIRSKVAFKAVGPDGLSEAVKGVVIDNNNKEIAKIGSEHLGMGSFTFIPEEGMRYKAKVTFADGSKSTIDLPEVELKGITLSVNTDDPSKVSVEIKANKAYYKDNFNKQLNLIIYGAGAVRTINTKLDNAILGLDLPSAAFKTGILQVTMLSQTGEPMNERMIFIQNPDLLDLSLNVNKAVFAKREKVELGLNAKNIEGSMVTGNFSVSVVDESRLLVDEDKENSILSYLLLTSDIKGYVEKPNYYFAHVTKETRANLDDLMLTQGYRRFVWKDLLTEKLNTFMAHKPEQYLDISGTFTTKSGLPVTNAKINLLPMGNSATTDLQGKFRFSKISFQNGADLLLETNSSHVKKGAVIKLDKLEPEPAADTANSPGSKYDNNADILASLQNNQMSGIMTASNMSNILLIDNNGTTRINKNNNYRSSNLAGPGHADQVISGDEVKNFPTLSSGLNGKARGVDFEKGVPYLRSGQVVSNGNEYVETMLLVVDGVLLGVNNSIDYINPTSVETVEILKGNSGAIYGFNSGSGVMVITTKQGESTENVKSNEMSPGIFSIHPDGYYKAREFYSPVYNVSETLTNIPDNRITVFWKPDVTTASDGKASFKYFNTDQPGSYRVVVEGIDTMGNLGRQVLHYTVK